MVVPLMRSLPQAIIAAVNGPVAGLGHCFVLGSDVALSGESAFFVNGFNSNGGGAEGGLSYLLPRGWNSTCWGVAPYGSEGGSGGGCQNRAGGPNGA